MSAQFEAVIGLEIHCQLATDSKIFCSCRARLPEGASVADQAANENTCPVCTGHPGTLPVLNEKVVEYAVRAGLAIGCTINRENVFARKNYFYPDLPKGYQISQFDRPICENGTVEIEVEAGGKATVKTIRVQRIHIEEDAGKNVHMGGYSLVNLNRAGVPLVEIVSAPDLQSPEEAGAYMRAVYSIVTYLGICDGNLQEGNFRCDANVSVMPQGSKTLGTRAEIKNVNSFRFVEKAIEYEIARQIELVRAGGTVVQETRSYDSDKNITFSLRSKEEAHDYRYFPEPDLLPVRVSEEFVQKTRASLPELPQLKRARYVAELGLSPYDAGVLTASKAMGDFFEACITECTKSGQAAVAVAKPMANLITGAVARRLNDEGIEITRCRLTPRHLADLVRLNQAGELSSTGTKQVLVAVWKTGEAVNTVVERDGLKQVSDLSALEPIIDQVLADSPAQVAEFRAGKEKVLGFLVGQVMKRSGGKANPALLQELIKKKLS